MNPQEQGQQGDNLSRVESIRRQLNREGAEEDEVLLREMRRRLNEMGSHLLFAGLSLTTSASERSSNERELLGEFLFELRKLQEQGWESLPLHKFLESETNSTWCSLDEDLLGLRILRGAESLGRHLLSRIEKDVA